MDYQLGAWGMVLFWLSIPALMHLALRTVVPGLPRVRTR
jgi:hypothetical protein